MIKYPRLKYGADRRDWVRVVDEKLPDLIALAINKQHEAAKIYQEWSKLSAGQQSNYSFLMNISNEIYADARLILIRVIYYQGMRAANYDPRDWS